MNLSLASTLDTDVLQTLGLQRLSLLAEDQRAAVVDVYRYPPSGGWRAKRSTPWPLAGPEPMLGLCEPPVGA